MNFKNFANSRSKSISQFQKFQSISKLTRSSDKRSVSLNSINSQKISPFTSPVKSNNFNSNKSQFDRKISLYSIEASKIKQTPTIKRNFNAFINSSKANLMEKSKINALKSKIEEMFRKMNSDSSWKNIFKDLFEKEKIIDFSSQDFIPKSLNHIGSFILKSEKFWVLWLEITKKELKLENLINLTNNALTYLNDHKLIMNAFNKTIYFLKFPKKVINDYISNQGIKVNLNNYIGEYNYLLDINLINNPRFPKKSKTQKQLKSEISHKFLPFAKQIAVTQFSNKDEINCIMPQESLEKSSPIESVNYNQQSKTIKPESTQSFQTFSVYNLIVNSQNSIEQNGDLENNTFDLQPSNITVQETQNEQTLNDKTDSFNHTPEINTNLTPKSVNSLMEYSDTFITPAKLENSYYSNSLLKIPLDLINTNSIVDEIQKLTKTLKKEIEQLKSPEFSNNNKCTSDYCVNNCYLFHEEANKYPVIASKSCGIGEEINKSNLNSLNSMSCNENKLKEDSYEKHLKEIGLKKGENLNEYISYSDFKPDKNEISCFNNLTIEKENLEDVSGNYEFNENINENKFNNHLSGRSKRKHKKSKIKKKSKSKSRSKSKKSRNKNKSQNK